MVPAYSLQRELLLHEAHDGVISGHFGVEKTRQQLQLYYYWPELLIDVQHHVGSYPTCQVMKSSRRRKAGQLQPIPPPERAWQQVTVDFFMGLPLNPGGNDAGDRGRGTGRGGTVRGGQGEGDRERGDRERGDRERGNRERGDRERGTGRGGIERGGTDRERGDKERGDKEGGQGEGG
ncbi:unnamed protein product [Closterium sp. NIES-54]